MEAWVEAWVEVLAVRRVEEFGVLERLERLNSGDITTNEKQVQLAYRRGRRRRGGRRGRRCGLRCVQKM